MPTRPKVKRLTQDDFAARAKQWAGYRSTTIDAAWDRLIELNREQGRRADYVTWGWLIDTVTAGRDGLARMSDLTWLLLQNMAQELRRELG